MLSSANFLIKYPFEVLPEELIWQMRGNEDNCCLPE